VISPKNSVSSTGSRADSKTTHDMKSWINDSLSGRLISPKVHLPTKFNCSRTETFHLLSAVIKYAKYADKTYYSDKTACDGIMA
jgi:hypothetical protein